MTKLVFVTNTISAISETTYDGKAYLVAPTVAIKEGVLNGFLYLAEEFSKYVGAWDGRPVPIGHPKRAGEYVSANSPDIWATEVMGQLWNTNAGGVALKSEIWIDLEKAEKIGEPAMDVVERLRAGDGIEVSTGLWFDLEETPGEWNGIPYEGIARNIRPDHLALLPSEIGACSWDDGCGVPRVNQQKGAVMGNEVKVNELTLDDRASLVRRAFWDQVADVDPDGWFLGDWDVVSVFDMTLIAKDWDTKNHSAFSYVIDTEGNVTFGEPVAVEVVYRAEGDGAEVVIANTTVPKNMAGMFARVRQWLKASNVEGVQVQEEAEVKKCDRVAALVANKQCKFSKEELEALSESQLTKLQESLATNSEAASEVEATPAANAAPVAQPAALDASQMADVIRGIVNESLAPVLATINANADRDKAGLVAALVANEQCQFDEAELTAMPTAQLQKLAASLQIRDYSGGAGVILNSGEGDDYAVMEMPKPTWVVAGEEK